MKKTLKDLRIGDPLYCLGGLEVKQTKVISMSQGEIGLDDYFKIPLVEGDWSRWRAEGRFDSIRREYFTEIRDVLRLSRSKYEMEIQRKYNAIRKILEDIERLRKEQMDVENRIFDDLKNQES